MWKYAASTRHLVFDLESGFVAIMTKQRYSFVCDVVGEHEKYLADLEHEGLVRSVVKEPANIGDTSCFGA